MKVFIFGCFLQLVLGRSTLESSRPIGIETNTNCHNFVPPVSYPLVWRNESIIESRHGVKLVDPYRWLENPYSNETKQFIRDQTELSDSYLKNCDAWQKIHTKLTEINNFKKYTLPEYYGDHYYFQMNTGLQHQNVYYRKKSLDDEPSVFLDPNEMSTDGRIAITSLTFSGDAKMVAYTFTKSGSDWNKLKIRNVETGEDYPETLEGLKFSVTSWTNDSNGFFYARYLKFGDGTETDKIEYQKQYYHRVGEAQEKDVLAFDFPEFPQSLTQTIVAEKYLVIQLSLYGDQKQHHLFYADLEKNGNISGKITPTPVYTSDLDSEFIFVSITGSKVFYITNRNAPNFRLVAIDLENPAEENWTTIIEEHSYDILQTAFLVGEDKIFAIYLHDVQTVLQLHTLDTGKLLRKIPFGMNEVGGVSIDKTQTEIFIQLNSFLSPGTVYRYNFTDPQAKATVFYEMTPNVNGFDTENFDVKQVFYPSHDGTQIPMFLVQKKTDFKGPKPTLLYGYGGFRTAILPTFNLDWFFFVNAFDGILAVANIRGGGEYGTKWHRDGILFKKQNSYDDFHAAAEYLIENQLTTRNKLAIRGESNGGILIGACINQRSDLYGAAVVQAGVLDMIRFPLFTFPAAVIPEFGDPENRSDFENLWKFSPMHNIRTPNSIETQYPATLIITADHDNRVSPLHSFKFTATLQNAVQWNAFQKNPILMKLLEDAGHSDGKPTYKLIDQESDILTFLYRALSIDIKL